MILSIKKTLLISYVITPTDLVRDFTYHSVITRKDPVINASELVITTHLSHNLEIFSCLSANFLLKKMLSLNIHGLITRKYMCTINILDN